MLKQVYARTSVLPEALLGILTHCAVSEAEDWNTDAYYLGMVMSSQQCVPDLAEILKPDDQGNIPNPPVIHQDDQGDDHVTCSLISDCHHSTPDPVRIGAVAQESVFCGKSVPLDLEEAWTHLESHFSDIPKEGPRAQLSCPWPRCFRTFECTRDPIVAHILLAHYYNMDQWQRHRQLTI